MTARARPALALAAITVVAAVAYGWGLTRVPLEPYYAAAVQAMAGSWHAFLFGAFDPAATVSMDKLPGAFWVQALAVRVLGPAPWVMVVPQVVEGVAAVVALFAAVRVLAGTTAGLVAALVLAVSPAAVAAARGNVADPLMVLLLVLAAGAVARAIRPPSPDARGWPWLLAAGVLLGFAFQAKMLAAWLVLPGLVLALVVAAAGSRRRRAGLAALVVGVTVVVSLAWSVVVSLVPADRRPWVDGSTHDSLVEQIAIYNGFGRLGAQNPLQILTGQGLALSTPGRAAGWDRLLVGDLGRDVGWLLPAAVIVAVIGLWALRRAPRTDPLRASYLLWGGWLVVYAVAFSAGAVINVYYTATLVPACAGLLATGVAHWRGAIAEGAHPPRALVPVVLGVSVLYAAALVLTAPGPGRTLGLAAVVVAVLAAVGASLLAPRRRAMVATGLVALLAVPVLASVTLVAAGRGAFDTPFESPTAAAAVHRLLVTTPRAVATTLPTLERVRDGAPDLLAVQSAAVASVFAYPSGQEVLPIGGFTGTGPSPTVDQVRDDVARGRFHLVLAFPGPDPRVSWIAAHCPGRPAPTPPFVEYYCTPSDAG